MEEDTFYNLFNLDIALKHYNLLQSFKNHNYSLNLIAYLIVTKHCNYLFYIPTYQRPQKSSLLTLSTYARKINMKDNITAA